MFSIVNLDLIVDIVPTDTSIIHYVYMTRDKSPICCPLQD